MYSPQTDTDGWVVLPDETTELALRQDCLNGLLATVQRLREIIARVPLSLVERQVLLSQLWRIQQYVKEPVNSLVADRLLRNN
jgi:hypothetical protein